MPEYDYKCDCGETTSEFRRISDRDAPIVCKKCGHPMHRALSTSTAFILIGEGWAKDGYQKK